ncbi:MAG: BatA domain-containing protein [Planctomycetota bacterium]
MNSCGLEYSPSPEVADSMPYFTAPLALAGLASVPILIGIYWFRNRYRKQTVSSLMFWLEHQSPKEGGIRLEKLQTPLLFFLELLALICLALAAATPFLESDQSGGPILVVLDDSYSMLAGANDSAKDRASAGILEELGRHRALTARFILAQQNPLLLGDEVHSVGEAETVLSRWTCESARAHLQEAVALASELGGKHARILVVSDTAPPEDFKDGRVQWWSFGHQLDNLAIVSATRTPHEGVERCLFEVANLSRSTAAAQLVVEVEGEATARANATFRLEAGAAHREVIELPKGTPKIVARLGDDELLVDNRVTLVPAPERNVRVSVRMRDETLAKFVQRALLSSGRVEFDDLDSELIFSDDPEASVPGSDTWLAVIAPTDEEAKSYLGPFVLDYTHTLAGGLSLDGAVWGAGQADPPGSPLITAGNTVLVSAVDRGLARHDVRFNFDLKTSTVQNSPNWPILIWNLLDWRLGRAPGLRPTNARLGTEVKLNVEADLQTVEVTRPDGGTETIQVTDRTITIPAERTGVHRIRAGENSYEFGVSAVSRDESDLTNVRTGDWGRWLDDAVLRRGYLDISWIFLTIALAALTAHTAITHRVSRRGVRT